MSNRWCMRCVRVLGWQLATDQIPLHSKSITMAWPTHQHSHKPNHSHPPAMIFWPQGKHCFSHQRRQLGDTFDPQPKRAHGKYSWLRHELSLALRASTREIVCGTTVIDTTGDEEHDDYEIVAAHKAGGHDNTPFGIPNTMKQALEHEDSEYWKAMSKFLRLLVHQFLGSSIWKSHPQGFILSETGFFRWTKTGCEICCLQISTRFC